MTDISDPIRFHGGCVMLHSFSKLEKNAYRCITADPPWSYSVFSEKGKGRSADAHYQCMTLADIAALPVGELATKDCHLFLWITGPCLVQGYHINLMKAWGFKPSSDVFVWLKIKKGLGLTFISENCFGKGMGHTTRKNAEYVVLGRRGSPKRKIKSMHQLILSERREHSRKPEEFFARVEQYCDGPYIELFARQSRSGWDCWGDQAGLFDKGHDERSRESIKARGLVDDAGPLFRDWF